MMCCDCIHTTHGSSSFVNAGNSKRNENWCCCPMHFPALCLGGTLQIGNGDMGLGGICTGILSRKIVEKKPQAEVYVGTSVKHAF